MEEPVDIGVGELIYNHMVVSYHSPAGVSTTRCSRPQLLQQLVGGLQPPAVRLQIHIVEGDPWAEEDLPAAQELAAAAGGELFLYEGSGHLVADPGPPDYDPETARLILERTLALLTRA